MKLSIPDMTCGHCKASVEGAVARVAPGAAVAVDLDAKTAEIDGAPDPEAVLGAIRAAGFDARLT
jgi:copper chaperone